MQNSDKYGLVLALLRRSLWGRDEELLQLLPEDTDWSAVWQELRDQAVHGLTEPILEELPLGRRLDSCRRDCIVQQARWHQVAAAQQQLLELLEANRIPCVIIKGMAAGTYYPHPQCRTAGDVDLLVKRADFDRAAALMETAGYVLENDTWSTAYHNGYRKNGIDFELHRWLGSLSETDEELISLFEEGIDRRVAARTEGCAFPRLEDRLNGLVLLLHIQQHLRSGLGLRQLVDWMMFLNDPAGAHWLEENRELVRRCGLEKLAVTVTALCQERLGLRTETDWAAQAEPELCQDLLEYLLEKGNFGQKQGTEGHMEEVFQDASNSVRLLRRLQRGGLIHWQAAREHRLLRPFAWIYQIGRILKQRKKWKLNELQRQKAAGASQREMLRRLGLGQDQTLSPEGGHARQVRKNEEK